MQKKSSAQSGIFNPRLTASAILAIIGFVFLGLATSPAAIGHKDANSPIAPSAPTPGSGTLSTTVRLLTYMEPNGGVIPNPSEVALSMPNCTVPMSCSTYTLTIDPTVGTASAGYDPTQYQIFLQWQWSLAAVDYDIFVENAAGTSVIASNRSTSDPSSIVLPTNTPAGTYKLVVALATGAPIAFTGTIELQAKPAVSGLCNPAIADCTPPRYQNYSAGPGQADNSGEPSLGVDWNPNVASLKHNLVNTGGVAFFTAGSNEWRVNFDDCSSPAINVWEDVSALTTQTFVLSDPIGFVDHYSSSELGLTYPPPTTPGRVFSLDLIGGQGDSLGSYSDDDGASYLPGGNGGPGAGPDHETLGGGPYNPNSVPPPPPQGVAYGSPNAIYYCSQNIAAEAQCSRSDNGGQTFGPSVPIFNPTQCTGGIHGHVKVARDGTVYVPNSSCGTVGGDGVAVSTDNGLTWTENNVPGSTGSQDPSVGIGQNNVGKPGGQTTNTIYLGWTSGDGHAHVAHSGDRGATWAGDTDVGAPVGVTHAVFPVVVAGDDNRAAFAFVGTGDGVPSGVCNPYGAVLNCQNIWHMYVATTYDGGANWITVDATPNDPVQQGTVCLEGTTCAGGRNLLDFNDFAIDAEGRGLIGYADGCVNCGNTFQGQSSSAHGTVTRQSGGRRLFAHFDPVEPAPPAAPRMISAVRQSTPSGVLVTWLEPDNGGSPITGYKVYRGTSSGTEVFLANVSGVTNTKYFDATAPAGNLFYYATAINAVGESTHCRDVSLTAVVGTGNSCTYPYLGVDPAGSAGTISTDPTLGSMTIQSIAIGEPFTSCSDNSITFLMKVKTLDPNGTGTAVLPPNGEWQILFGITDTLGRPQTIFVDLDTNGIVPTAEYSYGRQDPSTTGGTLDSAQCTAGTGSSCPAISGSYTADGYITIKLNASAPLSFTAPTAGATGVAFTWDPRNPGTILGVVPKSITGNTFLLVGGVGTGLLETVQTTSGGQYTRVGNSSCQSTPPIAVLSATPMSGAPPLSVTFNGTSSHEPTGACGTINSYTLDFGDGTTPVTNGSGMFSHTYNNPGDYPARLTVKDSVGLTSTNVAQLIITVAGTPPPLSSVVSRKVHGGSAGTFDVPLQKDAVTTPRGVECRTGGANGDHSIVFTFTNNLTSVASANLVSGPGSIVAAGTGIGPAANQYTVNITGVTNGQYVSVALVNALDSAGNIGDVATTMGALNGDTNADGSVNSADISQTKSQSGQIVVNGNFREDVNIDGSLNSADISLVKSRSGTALPTTP